MSYEQAVQGMQGAIGVKGWKDKPKAKEVDRVAASTLVSTDKNKGDAPMLSWLPGLLRAFLGFTANLTTTFGADETTNPEPPPTERAGWTVWT